LSSLKERGRVKSFDEGCGAARILLICLPFLVAGAKQPADGVMVERPQRSEDERPWGRQGLVAGWEEKGTGLPGSGLLWPGVEGGCSSIASNRWPRQPEARVPVIPSPRHGGMELCGRSRAGSIKRATTPPSGVMTNASARPGCARAGHYPTSVDAGTRQRTWPSRRP
jgi:hypothetical protein